MTRTDAAVLARDLIERARLAARVHVAKIERARQQRLARRAVIASAHAAIAQSCARVAQRAYRPEP